MEEFSTAARTKYHNLGLNSGSSGSYESKITVSAGMVPPAGCEKAGVPGLSPELVDASSPCMSSLLPSCVSISKLPPFIRTPVRLE